MDRGASVELTAKEQRALRRLERLIRQGRFVVYPLVAMFFLMVGVTLYAFLVGAEQCVVMLFFLVAAHPLYCVMYFTQARLHLRIIKKLQGQTDL